MTDRDHFAAAALTGLLSNVQRYQNEPLTRQAFEIADFMLRERCRGGGDCPSQDNVYCTVNHDAAPAARGDARECASPVTTGGKPAIDRLREWERHGSGRWGLGAAGDVTMLERRLAMVEEIVHDAAPAARASVESVAPQPTTRGDSDRTDKAAPRPSEGTGDTPKPINDCVSDRSKPITGPDPDSRVWETHTPATHATQGECSKPREGKEPVAWAVMPSNSDYCVTLSTRKEAAKKAAERKVEVGEYATMDDIVVVPLYRHPPCQDFSQKNLTLTDAERKAVAFYSRFDTPQNGPVVGGHAAALRGLLERLGGVR